MPKPESYIGIFDVHDRQAHADIRGALDLLPETRYLRQLLLGVNALKAPPVAELGPGYPWKIDQTTFETTLPPNDNEGIIAQVSPELELARNLVYFIRYLHTVISTKTPPDNHVEGLCFTDLPAGVNYEPFFIWLRGTYPWFKILLRCPAPGTPEAASMQLNEAIKYASAFDSIIIGAPVCPGDRVIDEELLSRWIEVIYANKNLSHTNLCVTADMSKEHNCDIVARLAKTFQELSWGVELAKTRGVGKTVLNLARAVLINGPESQPPHPRTLSCP